MKKLRSSKAIAVVVACVCVVTLLLTGTFAWFKVSEARNEFSGWNKDALLHDDYKLAVDTTGEINKDIYAENTGVVPIYVRILLQEYMDLTSSQAPANIEDLWETHIPGATEAFHPTFTWTLGGQKDYLPGVPNETQGNPTGTRLQTPMGEVITMAAYKAMSRTEQAAFAGWVYDVDGYAYWSQPLAPGEATGLLMDSVTVSAAVMDTDYYYVINVILEAVDDADLPMWLDGAASVKDGETTQTQATDDAQKMLRKIAGLDVDPDWVNELTGTSDDIGKILVNVDGYDWIVLYVDGSGNTLIISKDVVTHTYYGGSQYAGSGLQSLLAQEFDKLTTLKKYARGGTTPLETGSFSASWNQPAAYSACDGTTEGSTVTAFALSASDFNRLFSNARVSQYKIARINGTAEYWWLRSNGNTSYRSNISLTGTVGGYALPYGSNFGVRPALWINTQ